LPELLTYFRVLTRFSFRRKKSEVF